MIRAFRWPAYTHKSNYENWALEEWTESTNCLLVEKYSNRAHVNKNKAHITIMNNDSRFVCFVLIFSFTATWEAKVSSCLVTHHFKINLLRKTFHTPSHANSGFLWLKWACKIVENLLLNTTTSHEKADVIILIYIAYLRVSYITIKRTYESQTVAVIQL